MASSDGMMDMMQMDHGVAGLQVPAKRKRSSATADTSPMPNAQTKTYSPREIQQQVEDLVEVLKRCVEDPSRALCLVKSRSLLTIVKF
jgi:hypothetical protein